MSEALNVTRAAFGGLREVTTAPLWQYDYGQILEITGLDLPQAFEVHFSNSRKSGETITQIGTDSQVTIPDMYLTSGADIYCFIFLHDGTDDGETEYVIKIPVRERPEPSDIEPTPEQQDAITEAIAALNVAVTQTGQDVISADASAQAAAQSATDAQTAAQSAQGSAISASASATTASTAASTATTKASEAAQSASEAESARASARNYAASASDSAGDADTAKTAAQSAAQTATTKAGEASTSATSASGSASAASASASAASGSATSAANSATAASGSATSAAGSATTASTKASEASASATAAQTAQTAAEAAQAAAETAAATFETDTTLTISGKAADAKATGDAVNDLKSHLDNMHVESEISGVWAQGGYKSADGQPTGSTSTNYLKRIRASLFDYDTSAGIKIVVPQGLKVTVYIWHDESTYETFTEWKTGEFYIYQSEKKYKLTAAYLDATTAIAPSAGDDIEAYALSQTDKTLKLENFAADAKIVGDILDGAVTYGGVLAKGTDLNTVSKVGIYNLLASGNYANAPANLKNSGNLIVLGSASIHMQIISASNEALYYRNYVTSGGYLRWQKISGFFGTFPSIAYLTDADDLNQLKANGVYLYNTQSIPANAPDDIGGIVLNFMYDDSYGIQIKSDRDKSFTRTSTLSGWGTWENIKKSKDELSFRVVKGAWHKEGTIVKKNVKALCADHIFELTPKSQLTFYLDPGWTYTIKEGDSETELSEQTAHLSKAIVHSVKYPFVAITFNRFVDGEDIDLSVDDFDSSVIIRKSGDAIVEGTEDDGAYHDFPETYGQLNVVYRAYQMSHATYTTEAVLPMHGGGSKVVTIMDVDAGTKVTGIPYSSMRETMMSVPQALSFHSFMTAIRNPNSYLYTRHYEQVAPGYDYNSRCYFGTVCSALVAYVYGVEDVIPTTISFVDYPGFEPLPEEQQNPYSLKLADMLNHAGDHIVIITDIVRNYRGRIEWIEVTEAWKPLCRTVKYTPAQIQSRYFNTGYIAYRYSAVNEVQYVPDPWIHVDNTETDNPVYTPQLCPRKGDKANWSVGETVEIDILDSTGYTGYEVTNLGTGATIATGTIPANALISLSELNGGQYAVRLTGTENSGYVYFDVIDMTVNYTPLGNHQVRVEFSSPQGTPSVIYWCCNVVSSSDYKAVRAFHLLTNTEKSAGYAVIDEPTEYRETDTTNGVWLMRMGFVTEFGLYASDLTTVSVN